jgi:hypothetical protein
MKYILLVEDDCVIAMNVERVLRRIGCTAVKRLIS